MSYESYDGRMRYDSHSSTIFIAGSSLSSSRGCGAFVLFFVLGVDIVVVVVVVVVVAPSSRTFVIDDVSAASERSNDDDLAVA